MEQEIAALAGAEEIPVPRRELRGRLAARHHHVLPESPDVVGAAAIAALGDESPCGDDMAARQLAVEADAHDPARAQDRDQHPPAGERVGEMVQHAAGLDQIEGPADGAQLHDVGLRIAQIRQSERARLALRIAQAGQAEIDRERVDADEPLGGLDRVLAGPAAGDQDLHALRLAEVGQVRQRQLAVHIHIEGRGPEHAGRPDPARIGVLLVLLLHQERDVIGDRREPRHRRAGIAVLQGLAHLLRQEPIQNLWP